MPNASTKAQQNTLTGIHPKTKRPTSLISQGKYITYTYDAHGNIKTKTKTETPINDYDPVGNLIQETLTRHHPQDQDVNGQTQSQTLSHHYDELGNRTHTTLPDQTKLNHLYYGSDNFFG